MKGFADHKIEMLDFGIVSYATSMSIQQRLHDRVRNEPQKGFLMFLEHESVVSIGKNADLSFLRVTEKQLQQEGVGLVRSDRGGQITAHMPGQLVIYPILNLGKAKVGARAYVCMLEQAIIDTLSEFGITASREEGQPGVWVNDAKICALGIRISRGVSKHGVALNVNNNLELFHKMVPCGLEGRFVTSMEQIFEHTVKIQDVQRIFCDKFSKVIGCKSMRSIPTRFEIDSHKSTRL